MPQGDLYPRVGWCEPFSVYGQGTPWPAPKAPFLSSHIIELRADVHHMTFPMAEDSKATCGTVIMNQAGTTGVVATPDIGVVTCLRCLRLLAKRAVGE